MEPRTLTDDELKDLYEACRLAYSGLELTGAEAETGWMTIIALEELMRRRAGKVTP